MLVSKFKVGDKVVFKQYHIDTYGHVIYKGSKGVVAKKMYKLLDYKATKKSWFYDIYSNLGYGWYLLDIPENVIMKRR